MFSTKTFFDRTVIISGGGVKFTYNLVLFGYVIPEGNSFVIKQCPLSFSSEKWFLSARAVPCV